MRNLNPNASGPPARAQRDARSGGYDPAVSEDLDRLAALVARLRRDCPWDREQSFDTLKTYLLEETYETLAALDAGDPDRLRDELGDLLFQVFFLARLSEERGGFGIDEVARGITAKMTERHPHVFGARRRKAPRRSKSAWEKRKRRDPDVQEDPLGSLPAALPALATAYRQTHRAADLGFDWERTPTSPPRSRRNSPSGGRPKRPEIPPARRTRSAISSSRSSTSRAAGRSTPRAPCGSPTGASATIRGRRAQGPRGRAGRVGNADGRSRRVLGGSEKTGS